MTVTNIEEARRSPVTQVERRLAEVEARMTELKAERDAAQKEINELFQWKGQLEVALSTLKKLAERND